MLQNKHMKFIKTDGQFDYYVYKPTIFHLYYQEIKEREEPEHRYKLSHKLHMLLYLLTSGYEILYLCKDDVVVSYIIYVRCNSLIMTNYNKNDYYTIFLWTYPQYRKQGIASRMAKFMLHELNIKFRYFYKTISKDNISSIKVAENCGFIKITEANKRGFFHKIFPVEEGM